LNIAVSEPTRKHKVADTLASESMAQRRQSSSSTSNWFAKAYGWLFLWARLFPDDGFLTIPITYIVLNIIVVVALSLGIKGVPPEYPGLVDQGIRMSQLVATASISIVTLTFSLTVLSIQIASQSYSPRLLDDFLKDPVSKVVISTNLGAYAYSYTIQYFLDDLNNDSVPYVSIQVLSLHMALVLLSFVNFIHLFINGFRVESILSRARDSSLQAAKTLSLDIESFNSSSKNDEVIDFLISVPSTAYKVLADESGYVKRFKLNAIVGIAKELDVCIRYNYQIGEFINEGTVLCYIWDTGTRKENRDEPLDKRVVELVDGDGDTEEEEDESWERKVERKLGILAARGIHISKLRQSDLDVTLGIQQLSDIAIRALSPGINDPHTAIQCLDTLSSLLYVLGKMELGVPNVMDDESQIRACAPRRSFAFLLSLLEPIRKYGATDLGVCRRGLRLFGDLAFILVRAGRLERVVPALVHLQQWMIASKESFQKGSPELKNLQGKIKVWRMPVSRPEGIFR